MPPLELAARMLYWFFVYGLLGWCLEVMFAAVKERRLVNRGFLCGPICPIYGFGMVALLLAVRALGDPGGLAGAAVTFVTGMVLATLVELVAGWALFQLYHIRWWDYSHLKGNIGGYICPQFSLLWGLGSVVMVHAVHPLLAGPGNALPLRALLVLDAVLLVFFAVDVGRGGRRAEQAVEGAGYLPHLDAAFERYADRGAGHRRHDGRHAAG